MSYWALNAIFLAITAAVVIVGLIVRRTPHWSWVAIGTGILLLVTAVFDNVMISVGLIAYNPALISGVFIGVAPLEDFAYALVAGVGLPAVWALIGQRRARDA